MSRLFASIAPTTPTSGSHRAPVALRTRAMKALVLLVALLIATLGLPTAIAQTSASAAPAPARVTPLTNPDLAAGCGLDVVLVLDASGSIGDVKGAVQGVKDAADTFLDAFQDTNTRVGIVSFNTTASIKVPMTYVTAATNSGSGVHAAAVNAYASGGRTNWQDALIKANSTFTGATARSVPKLIVFVTDGAPNTINKSGGGTTNFGDADAGAVDPAVTEMNAMKKNGIHSLVVGVGAAFDNTSASDPNIDALYRVSEFPTPKIYPDTAFDAATTDLILQKDFSALEADLRNVANAICDGTLIVTKYTSDANTPNTYAKAGSGWGFTTTVSPTGGWLLPTPGPGAARSVTTDATGTALFQWNPGTANWAKDATVTDTSQTNYTPDHVTCTVNGVAITNPSLGGTGGKNFNVNVGSGKKVECNVYNKYTGPLNTDVAIAKSVSASTVVVGDTVTWTLKATNNGPNTATNVVFTDTLPAGLGTVSNVSAPAGTTYAAGVWTIPSLSVGAAAAKTLTFQTTVDTVGDHKNVVSLTKLDQHDTNGNNDSANATVTGTKADVTVSKTANVATQIVNGNVVFTITAKNLGDATAQGVKVTDNLPAGLTWVSDTATQGSYDHTTGVWTIGSLAKNASAVLTLTAKGTTVGTKTNTAVVSTNTPESDTTNNKATADVKFTIADLTVTKTADKHSVVLGDTVVWTVTVNNTGDADAANVVVTDAIPAGLTVVSTVPNGALVGNTWTVGTVAAGGSKVLTVTTTVNSLDPITNKACATTTTPESSTTNNCGQDTVQATASDVTVTKVPDISEVFINGSVVWTVTVKNSGKADAKNVVVTDTAPAGLTLGSGTPSQGTYDQTTKVWTVGTVNGTVSSPPNGGTATLTINSTVGNTLGQLTNKVDVTTTTPETNSNNNHGEGTVNVTAADVVVSKTADKHDVYLGDTVVWTIKATNNGPASAAGVKVTDVIPAGIQVVSTVPVSALVGNTWTIGTLASGASATLVLTTTTTATGTITNSVTVSTTTPESNPNNNEGHDTIHVTVADVSVTKVADDHAPVLGGTVVWTVKATNSGSADAANTVVTDVIPAGLTLVGAVPSAGSYDSGTGAWTIGTLAKNTSATLVLTTTTTKTGSIKNTACAATSTPDTTKNDDCGDDTVTVHAPSLTISKVASVADANLQGSVSWTVKVTNSGDAAANGVVVTDVLPAGLTLVGSVPSVGTYDAATGAWTIGTLGINGSATLVLTTTVTKTGAITNTACVATTSQQAPSQNLACDDDTVTVHAPNVSVTKVADVHDADYQGPVTWTIKATNSGDADAAGVVVADPAVAGLTIDSSSTTAGTFDPATHVWTIGTLAKGSTETLTLHTTVTKTGPITNTACITTTSAQVSQDARCDHDTVKVHAPVLSITKVANDGSVVKGDSLTWTITVSNTGDANATGVIVTDTNPGGGLTLTGGTPSKGTFDASTGIWTVGTVAAGTNQTLVVTTGTTKTGTLTNKACATTASALVSPALVCDDDTVKVNAADVTVTKTADQPVVVLGNNVTFTVTATNNGAATAQDVSVSDVLPAGLTLVSTDPANSLVGNVWSVGTLAANGGTKTLKVTTTTTQTGAISNAVHISTTTPETDTTNNDAHADITVTAPNLTITKTADLHQTYLGGNVVWTVTVANTGDAAAANVSVADVLPAGLTLVSTDPANALVNNTWTVGTLAKGASATLELTTKTTQTGNLTNEACVTTSTNQAPVAEGQNADRCDSDTTIVTRDVHLTINKTQDASTPNPRQPGSQAKYDITVTNTGKSPSLGAHFTDTLPAGLNYVSATGTGWTCTNTGQSVDCTLASELAAGATSTPVVITTTVDPVQLLRADPVTNVACITPAPIQDGPVVDTAGLVRKAVAVDEAGECSQVQTTFPKGTLSLEKSNNPTKATDLDNGDTITYTLKVSANGELDQKNVVVSDDVPGFGADSSSFPTTYVGGSATCVAPPAVTAANCTVTPTSTGSKVSKLTWALGDLAHGQSRTVTFKVTVDTVRDSEGSLVSGTVSNAGSVQSDETTTVPSNTVTNPVEPTEVLGTKQPADNGSPAPSGVLAHTGANLFRELGLALSLLITGAFVLRGTRRREQGEH